MPRYRFNFRDARQRIERKFIVECAGDEEAIVLARRFGHPGDVEIYRGDEMLLRIERALATLQ